MELTQTEFEVLISQHDSLARIGSPACRRYHESLAAQLRQNRDAALRKEQQQAQKRAA